MEVVGDCDSEEECSYEIRKVLNEMKDAFISLKGEYDELGTILPEMNEFQFELKKYRKVLYDKAIIVGVNDYSSLDTIDSVDRFMAEELEALRESEHYLNQKMDEFAICLMDVKSIFLQDGALTLYRLVTEVAQITKSMFKIIDVISKNDNVKSFRLLLRTEKSE